MQDEAMVKDTIDCFKQDLEKAIDHLNSEYQTVRAGRANPHLLDKVMVEYYGSMTPINQMANISVQEARVLAISVWDVSQVKNVSKAIQMADLGVNPSDDGKIIRLVFPAPTEERRKELVKQVKKLCEDTKVVLRNARRDCLDMFKDMKKNSEISEDEYAGLEKDVQKILDSYNTECEELCDSKEKEIMEI